MHASSSLPQSKPFQLQPSTKWGEPCYYKIILILHLLIYIIYKYYNLSHPIFFFSKTPRQVILEFSSFYQSKSILRPVKKAPPIQAWPVSARKKHEKQMALQKLAARWKQAVTEIEKPAKFIVRIRQPKLDLSKPGPARRKIYAYSTSVD